MKTWDELIDDGSAFLDGLGGESVVFVKDAGQAGEVRSSVTALVNREVTEEFEVEGEKRVVASEAFLRLDVFAVDVRADRFEFDGGVFAVDGEVGRDGSGVGMMRLRVRREARLWGESG